MRFHLSEGKFLVYSTIAIILLLAIHLFQQKIITLYNPENYVGFHFILEVFSISISAAIFLYALKTYGKARSRRMLLLAFTFFIVGALDTIHTLSFKGMPFFFTESSVAKATWFWVTARVFQALFIFLILLLPDRTLKKDYRWPMFIFATTLVVLISFIFIFFEKSLPLLVIEGKGTTPLKNGFEYFVSFVQFVSLIITLYQYYLEKSEAKLAIALALVYLLLTSLIFTVYQSVFDLDNFTGHLFKTIGFYYILRGFYFISSEQEHENQKEQTIIQQLPGFVFKAIKRESEFILTYGEGNMTEHLGHDQKKLLGQPLANVFPDSQGILSDYCRLCINRQEERTFEIDLNDKVLLFSIKPFVENDQDVILGTIVDVTGMYQEPPSKLNAII